MAITVPRYRLVASILRTIPHIDIRAALNIGPNTDLESRLNSFRKEHLVRLLRSTSQGQHELDSLKLQFPFGASELFYIVKVPPFSYTGLASTVNNLADQDREQQILSIPPTNTVRAVYVSEPAQVIRQWQLLEIPLVYERRIEYRIGDPPDDDNYGLPYSTYAVEPAFVWLVDDFSHGVVGCSGVAPLRAIIVFIEARLGISAVSPNMSQGMFNRLIEGSTPTSITFGFPDGTPTVSFYHPDLANTPEYKQLESNPDAARKAGYYRDRGGGIMTGYGVARLPARLWTHYRYDRHFLVSAMRSMISRTETELANEYCASFDNYVDYIQDAPVVIDGKYLTGESRQAFQALVKAIVNATQLGENEIDVQDQLVEALLNHYRSLHFEAVSYFPCNNCGGELGYCPQCLIPYEVLAKDGDIQFRCPGCKEYVDVETGVLCTCGTIIEIVSIRHHIRLYPTHLLLEAIYKFLDFLPSITWRGAFFVEGGLLRILAKKHRSSPYLPDAIALSDLRYWRTRARLHTRSGNRRYMYILENTMEYCKRDGTKANKERCDLCLDSEISRHQLDKEMELCLPRIMGLAIDHRFDGKHGRYEIADVRFDDILDESEIPVRVAIHLKSRNPRPRPEGEGRSTRRGKELYAQVFYLAYQCLYRDGIDFDVIGISIPNQLRADMRNSIRKLLNQLGFTFLAVEEEDWLRISDAVVEQLEFRSSTLPSIR